MLNPKQRLKSSGVVAGSIAKDEDDDCVVLDGDPDKPVAIENDSGVARHLKGEWISEFVNRHFSINNSFRYLIQHLLTALMFHNLLLVLISLG